MGRKGAKHRLVKAYLAVTVDLDVLEWIKRTRGFMSRSEFVNVLLKGAMKKTRIKILTIELDHSD